MVAEGHGRVNADASQAPVPNGASISESEVLGILRREYPAFSESWMIWRISLRPPATTIMASISTPPTRPLSVPGAFTSMARRTSSFAPQAPGRPAFGAAELGQAGVSALKRLVAAVCSVCCRRLAVMGRGMAADANRLVYLDESEPFYVSRDFARLVTPQWVGQEGVQAVVILAIDDMRQVEPWEEYLRPILERLKKIDGRAPVSIMTNRVDPRQPQLQSWLKEGVSLECHTYDHPCPLLQNGDFAAARSTYERCIDLLDSIPGNHAVAFRMPCCDSANTTSPRFFAEIFSRATSQGNFLSLDSSVCNIITADDPQLPRELVLDENAQEIFRKYIPFTSFVTTIEDYPYPYVIDRLCWEFPIVAPSDWTAQKLQKPNSPQTVRDWQSRSTRP